MVTSPTPWVSSMVVMRKSNGNLRLCIDPKDLNQALKRSHYPIPTIDEVLPEIIRARMSSTFDAGNGFWHIELDDGSSFLTTFNTPFGRFRWLRLPFGLASAPEEFQDVRKELIVHSDASGTELEAVLIQDGQPIAYSSCALSEAEKRYAQIGNELLAVVYGLEKFHQSTFGRTVIVQSDHKPLEVIVRKKLHKAPKHLQRMLLRIQVYDARIIYQNGKQMELADTLSRARGSFEGTTAFEREVETVNMTEYLSVSAARLDDIKAHTETDNELQMVIEVVKNGWPEERKKLPGQIIPY